MIKFENKVLASPEQMLFILQGMRNPMNSHEKSDSYITQFFTEVGDYVNDFTLGENDHSLMQRLSKAGTDHRKYMRMMPVYVRITAPLYWWKEFDTYKVGTVSNSCSTMHKIQEKEFTEHDFSYDHLADYNEYDHAIYVVDETIDALNYWRNKWLEIDKALKSNNLYGNDPETTREEMKKKQKDIWWQMIQLLPSSYNQTRNVMMNYEVLANIYKSRKNHKLNEWRNLCDWIESLPYSELITGSPAKQEQLMLEKQPYHWIEENDEYCNNCEHFHICLDKGGLVDVTTGDDIIKGHYINKPGYDCPKEIKIDNTSWAGLYRHGAED